MYGRLDAFLLAEKVKRKASWSLLLCVEAARCFPISQKSKKGKQVGACFCAWKVARCFLISRKSKKESKLELAFVSGGSQMLSY
ncbi:MAG TPA: hypothetical protein DCL29_05910 [Eubacterium sp.]|nr:hypothetical protein [Eubacterium sp.]